MSLLEVKNVRKIYSTRFSGNKVVALSDVNMTVEEGEFVAIMGESGSGKTTLLNIIAAMDDATSGDIFLNGTNIKDIKEHKLAEFRRREFGFVFQEFNLLDTFSIGDNIRLPLVLDDHKSKEIDDIVIPLAGKLGIKEILDKYPYEVSGGEKQRAACCRAVVMKPKLLLADEPTGSLDSKSTGEVLHLLEELHASGQTILLVTHSVKAASHASRVLFIKDGEVYHQLYRGDLSNHEFYNRISDSLQVLLGGR
ncbi:MAG: ABC transporter ATP-binding protein [Clostridia bacterium]|nr:ABC transporter ATP-binding protein [Clostridiales bacterium]MCR5803341.1 ABC transporter ATP-binding protein [Clostridia bacterium]